MKLISFNTLISESFAQLTLYVIPAQAGIQNISNLLDSVSSTEWQPGYYSSYSKVSFNHRAGTHGKYSSNQFWRHFFRVSCTAYLVVTKRISPWTVNQELYPAGAKSGVCDGGGWSFSFFSSPVTRHYLLFFWPLTRHYSLVTIYCLLCF
jgi:hypothetical protein